MSVSVMLSQCMVTTEWPKKETALLQWFQIILKQKFFCIELSPFEHSIGLYVFKGFGYARSLWYNIFQMLTTGYTLILSFLLLLLKRNGTYIAYWRLWNGKVRNYASRNWCHSVLVLHVLFWICTCIRILHFLYKHWRIQVGSMVGLLYGNFDKQEQIIVTFSKKKYYCCSVWN